MKFFILIFMLGFTGITEGQTPFQNKWKIDLIQQQIGYGDSVQDVPINIQMVNLKNKIIKQEKQIKTLNEKFKSIEAQILAINGRMDLQLMKQSLDTTNVNKGKL